MSTEPDVFGIGTPSLCHFVLCVILDLDHIASFVIDNRPI